MNYDSLLKSGWIHAAFLALLAYPLGGIVAKLVSSYLDTHILIYTVIFTTSSSIALLLRAGPGDLGLQTLLRIETWLFAFMQLSGIVFGLLIMKYVSATEGTSLYRCTILMVIVFSFIFISQRINKSEIIASIITFIGLGFIILSTDLNDATKALLFVLVLIRISAEAGMKVIGQMHKTNNQAKDVKQQSRVAGFIMMIVSIVLLIFLIITATFKEFHSSNFLDMFPSFSEFINFDGFFIAAFMGLFIISIQKYCEFYASKTVGATYLTAISALQIIFVYMLEWPLAKLGYMEHTVFEINNSIGLLLILTGNIIITISGFVSDKKLNTNKS